MAPKNVNAGLSSATMATMDNCAHTRRLKARFAALYLDRKISDGFETDPDDPSTLMLLAPDYAEKHDIQQAALAGDTGPCATCSAPSRKQSPRA
jgi:hypothetical protein